MRRKDGALKTRLKEQTEAAEEENIWKFRSRKLHNFWNTSGSLPSSQLINKVTDYLKDEK